MALRYRRKRRSDHGIDDWLMTYADMITLLLCFFAIFLSVSVPKRDQMEEATQRVLEKFASKETLNARVMKARESWRNPREATPFDSLPSIVDTFHSGEGRSVGEGVDAGEGQSEGMGEGPEQATAIQLNPPSSENPAPEETGDRIRIMDIPSAAFFASGSAALSDEGKALLGRIMDEQLNAPDVQDWQITVEGHTDDAPISTLQFPSNWELSTARAAAVVRFLIERGMPPQRLRAAGYSDIFPKVPNLDESGKAIPANRALNRRVVIRLEKIERLDPAAE